MTDETWKPIPGFDGYDVSDHGRVRSYRRCYGVGNWAIEQEPQRIMSPSKDKNGYLSVLLRVDGISYCKRIHALVALAFLGPCPDGLEVCHNDQTRTNNRLDNLRYDTGSANLLESNRSVMAAQKRAELQARRAERQVRSQSNLARAWGMSRERVRQILNRAGLNGNGRAPDWEYIDKRGLREYAETIGVFQEVSQ